MANQTLWLLVARATGQTSLMVCASASIALAAGTPLGILLCVMSPGHVWAHPAWHRVLSSSMNVLRAFPFVILLVVLLPLSRMLTGRTVGTAAAILPLAIAALPFVARVIESALLEVEPGIIQTAVAMGSSMRQLVLKIMLPEAAPACVSGVALMVINLIGYSAMAGAIGGGGLGDIAIRYGYQRFQPEVMTMAVLAILAQVALTQWIGRIICTRIRARR